MLRVTEDLEEQYYIGHHNSTCSYLADRNASLFFINGWGAGELYRILLDAGYRRNGQLAYRTDCDACRECQIIRIPVAGFQMTGAQQRIWKKGERSLRMELKSPDVTAEKLEIYGRYLRYQHGREEPREADSYREFFVDSFLGERTLEMNLFAGDQLAGVGILDRVGDILSSVYFYFNPDFAHLSPGTYSILKEIELCKAWNLSYYYPGYFVADCPAMSYKSRYGPAEICTPGEKIWRPIHNKG